MKQKASDVVLNEENVKKRIKSLLEEIQSEANPYLLNKYRSIFRKEVSFFRRSYLAAYLLLLSDQGQPARPSEPRRFESRRDVPRGGREEEPRFIPEEESARLFVSIGRSRKVFPRELLAFIIAKSQVSKDDIGSIRILDNYSFIQVRNTSADAIIQALNGQNFRGRNLTVNYARSKKDDEESSESE
jgi:hypothetical protein